MDDSNEKPPHILKQLVDKINKFYEETCEKKYDIEGDIIPTYRPQSYCDIGGRTMYALRSSAPAGVFFADILQAARVVCKTDEDYKELEIAISNMDIKKCGEDKRLYAFPDIELV